MRVVASIEARMGASRLPGKMLMPIGGRPAIAYMLDRVRQCRELDAIVVATTTNPSDDAIAACAKQEGIACFRGSEEDVLARVCDAQAFMKSDIVVELCGDCPFSDPDVIDTGISTFLAGDADVVSTTQKPEFPAGIDVQVFRYADLEDVRQTVGDDPAVREHVSLYFYEHPDIYRVHHMAAPAEIRRPDLRLLLDYAEDLALLRAVHDRLAPRHGANFGTADIVDLFRREPELSVLNAHCVDKAVR